MSKTVLSTSSMSNFHCNFFVLHKKSLHLVSLDLVAQNYIHHLTNQKYQWKGHSKSTFTFIGAEKVHQKMHPFNQSGHFFN